MPPPLTAAAFSMKTQSVTSGNAALLHMAPPRLRELFPLKRQPEIDGEDISL